MTTDTKTLSKQETAADTSPAKVAVTVTVDDDETDPEYKYSKGLKDGQRFERRVTKASRKVAKAVALGFDVYLERRDRSAGKKRDGALRDVAKNVSKATGEALKEISEVPYDLALAFDTKGTRKLTKQVIRSLAVPLPFLR
ncbi:hypothetical protein [Azospirillum sp. B4]|uniref:DUF6312 domain-containing protein n=1 Tax=Azospirillum sp. B4 TaxID=95605 RepID=UPI0011DCB4D4|nr:hypothetical protein [Azospirillum sp. B4]